MEPFSAEFFGKEFSTAKRPGKIRKIDERITIIGMLITTVTMYVLTFQNLMNPLYFSILFVVHLTLLLMTRFNETDPAIPLFILRHYESMVCYFLPFIYIAYILVIITVTPLSVGLASSLIFLKFALILYFWVILSSIPIGGIHFTITIFIYVVGTVIRFFPGYDPPVVLYFTFFMQFLWGLGYWYSHTLFFINAFRKKHDLGEKTNLVRNIAITLFVCLNIIGLSIILNEPLVFAYFKSWIH